MVLGDVAAPHTSPAHLKVPSLLDDIPSCWADSLSNFSHPKALAAHAWKKERPSRRIGSASHKRVDPPLAAAVLSVHHRAASTAAQTQFVEGAR